MSQAERGGLTSEPGAVYPVVPGGVSTRTALSRKLKGIERAVAEKVLGQVVLWSVNPFLRREVR